MSPRFTLLFTVLAATTLAVPASLARLYAADAAPPAVPAVPVVPAVTSAPAGEKPAKPVAPPIPADGVLLRYQFKPGQTLKLAGTIKIAQTYSQSDQDKPVDRSAQIAIDGEMAFLRITADSSQAVAEARIKSTTAGETTFTKSLQRIDSRGRVLNDQTDLPPPTPDKDSLEIALPPANTTPPAPAPSPAAAPAVAPAPAPAASSGGPDGGTRRRPPAGAPVGGPAAPAGPAGPAAPPAPTAKSADPAALQLSRLVLPEGKIKAGDFWTVESEHIQTGAAGAPRMKDTLVVTVKELKPAGDHNVAVLTFKLTSTPVETLAGLVAPTVTAAGESEFHLEAGVIVKSTLTTDTTAEATTDGVKSLLKIHAQADYIVTIEGGASGEASGNGNGGAGGWNGGPGGRSPRGGPGGGGPGGGH